MKFGMNVLLWTDNLTEAHQPILEQLKEMGYDGVELPIFDLNPDRFASIGLWLDDLGLERTGVCCRGVEDNPIGPDRKARRAQGVANNKLVLDCCQAAGMKILAGPYHSALGHFTGQAPTADEWKWGVESMPQTAEHAGTCGVKMAVEYLNRFECYLLNTAADTARFVREVNHPNFRMMYDTFHANIEEKSIPEAIRVRKETIHVHISENDRGTPGQGHVQWAETFDTLKEVGYDGWMMIEAFGLALPRLAAATKIWRRMFKDEMQLSRDGLQFMKSEWAKRSKQ